MNQKVDTFEDGRTISLGWKGRLGALIAALLLLGLFVYSETLSRLISSVLHREGSSHGLFVPFIAGYFIWLKREKIRQIELHFSPLPGAAMAVAGFFIFYISRGSTEVTFPALSFVIVVSGLVMALFGVLVFRELSFPFLFLITIIPIPAAVYAQIGEWMRSATTAGSVWLTQLIQLPVYREGYNVYLPNTNLFIAPSCSGIRYLLSYFVFGLAYAFLFKKGAKSRILVVLASFPIALIAGVLRLSSIYLSVFYIGAFMAGTRPHILVSWSVFLVVLVAVIAVDQSLSRWRQGA